MGVRFSSVKEVAEEVKDEAPDHRKAAPNLYLGEGKGSADIYSLAVS